MKKLLPGESQNMECVSSETTLDYNIAGISKHDLREAL